MMLPEPFSSIPGRTALHAKNVPSQINLQDRLQGLQRAFVHRPVPQFPSPDTGIAEQDIDPPPAFNGLVDDIFHCSRGGHIGDEKHHPLRFAAQALQCLFSGLAVDVHQRQPGALLSIGSGTGQPNAVCSPADQGDFSGKPHGTLLKLQLR